MRQAEFAGHKIEHRDEVNGESERVTHSGIVLFQSILNCRQHGASAVLVFAAGAPKNEMRLVNFQRLSLFVFAGRRRG